MKNFTKNIAPYVQQEIQKSVDALKSGPPEEAFSYLENAHVLGQASTYWHVKVHYLMLKWGIKQKSAREIFGQIFRIIGAALLTKLKGVPEGNTGGSNVSAVKPMPINPKFSEIIAKAKRRGH
ncbi:DUF3703 domain-containing protein [Pleionea mediterranea]|uniref:Uncharacterized protein DUF3703 n=1 Tax=Pleionea mediterranea TaxID=523701 RepID=A0A316FNQ0_9GAMM|nr:DUF3703 domain-containing protein [Pleionea mediterranea]PWK49883.1 uncharacterized protein DUF3703 [Pleionea mediterranea]